MNDIRVAVNGAKGRMGQASVNAVQQAAGMTLVAELDLGDDLGQMLKEKQVDVCVDFTHPSVGLENTLTILASGARPVVGTTGFTDAMLAEITAKSRESGLGVVIAPNFAIGAVLMMRFAREAAPFFQGAEIVELHHDRKADAPSGTALATANMMAAARQKSFPEGVCPDETLPGSRGGELEGIRLHSVRLPGYLAHQEVLLGDPGQTLTLRHDTQDRTCFMPGVVRSIEAVMQRNDVVVGLEQILFPDEG